MTSIKKLADGKRIKVADAKGKRPADREEIRQTHAEGKRSADKEEIRLANTEGLVDVKTLADVEDLMIICSIYQY